MAETASRLAPSIVDPILSLRRIRKTFSRGLARAVNSTTALADVDLDLSLGEVVVVAGSEAAGKTTLLQCAAGLLRPEVGDVRWYGQQFPGGGIVPGVAYVCAVPVFYPFLTVRDVVAYRAAREASMWDDCSAVVGHALDAVELTDRAADRVMLLSRAESKRLAVAEALASRPRVILLDTCTSDMTASVSEATCRAIERFAYLGGSALVAVRDATAVTSIATRLVLLSRGRISPSFLRSPELEHPESLVLLAPRFVAETLH